MIIFTVCTVSHLAQAFALKQSLNSCLKDFTFYIFLGDKIDSRISPQYTEEYNIIEFDESIHEDYEYLRSRYTVFEYINSLKPYAALYFATKYASEEIVYLDTDIKLFSNLNEVSEKLKTYNFILTAHFYTILSDSDLVPRECDILNTGLYNGGFFAFKAGTNAEDILVWWRSRLRKYCYNKQLEGFYVDQLWMQLMPIYFKHDVHVLEHWGYNVAYWNLHERLVSERDGQYFVNETSKLVFYHFSGFDILDKHIISKHQKRYSMSDYPALGTIYANYIDTLLSVGYNDFIKLENRSVTFKPKKKKKSFLKKLLGN
jgi:hypothetical protein